MQPEERTSAALWDMRRYALEALRITSGQSFEEWFDDPDKRYVLERVVQIIGEAATRVDKGFRNDHPEIDWIGITNMRHVLVNHYAVVRIDLLWKAATVEAAELVALLDTLVPPEPELGPEAP